MSADAFEMLAKIRMDLTAAQAKITDLSSILTELNLTAHSRPKCPKCGLSFKSSSVLDEHMYVSHNGPEPPAWVLAEEMSEQA